MNFAFVGGSITEGVGAEKYEDSYAGRLEKYLNDKYGNSNFKNMGVSGTASQYGMFRLSRDLGDFKPDAIFVEFSVNDRIYPAEHINIYFEGLIRECAKYTEKIIIIGMPTKLSNSVTSIHKKIAYFYNIPFIDVQDEVWRKIGRRETTWTKISIDHLHPNNNGHELYFEIIKSYLDKIQLEDIKIAIDYKTINHYKFINPRIEEYDSNDVVFYGNWKEEEISAKNDFGAVTYDTNGVIIYKFKGRYIGILAETGKNCGSIICSIDDRLVYEINLYNNIQEKVDIVMCSKELKNCEHVIKVKTEEKCIESMGTKVAIAGFLVDNKQKE